MSPLAQVSLDPLWEDHGIALAMMGMLVVFSALVLVSTFIAVLPRLMEWLQRVHPEAVLTHGKSKPAPKSTKKKPEDDDLPEEVLVVIAAAVAEMIPAPHRIVHTRQLRPEEHGWSLQGRMQHHTSHGAGGRPRG